MNERNASLFARGLAAVAKPYWRSDDHGAAWAALDRGRRPQPHHCLYRRPLQPYGTATSSTPSRIQRARLLQVSVQGFRPASPSPPSRFRVYQLYLQQMLQIRWRRWMTRLSICRGSPTRLLPSSARGRRHRQPGPAHFRGSRPFTRSTMGPRLLRPPHLGACRWFVPRSSCGACRGRRRFRWAAGPCSHPRLYGLGRARSTPAVGTWLTVKIGRPLVPLNFAQQRFEADFRFSLVRLRENTESVAFYGGEAPRAPTFSPTASATSSTISGAIMMRRKHLNWFTSAMARSPSSSPIWSRRRAISPGRSSFGVLQQVADAFVSGAVLAVLHHQRLHRHRRMASGDAAALDLRPPLHAIAAAARAPQRSCSSAAATGLAVERSRPRPAGRHAAAARRRLQAGPGEAC